MDDYFLVRYLDEDDEFICARETRHIHETLLVLKYVKDNEIEIELETEDDIVNGLVKEIIVHTGENETLTYLNVRVELL